MIGIKANKANATLIESEKLTSGRVGLPIYFEFSTEWDGLGVFAIYRAGNVVKKKFPFYSVIISVVSVVLC